MDELNKSLDGNGLLYFWQKMKVLLSGKVDKVDGKGLSTNDYTTTEKNKLSGIADGANKITVENVLTSTSTSNALSANQGKVLDEKIKALRIPTTVAELTDASSYAKKTDLSNVYRYMGSKAIFSQLPTSGNTVGDVWDVVADNGMNYGWNGSSWDPLGQVFTISYMSNADIDQILST